MAQNHVRKQILKEIESEQNGKTRSGKLIQLQK